MPKPNKTYLAGTITIPTASTDAAVLQPIFQSQVTAAGLTYWWELLVGKTADVYVFTFDQQITVKYGRLMDATILAGDAAVWRNPVPSTTYRTFNETQRRDNHTFRIDELYVTNASGSNVIIDVEVFANNNGPFLN
jgi:hypothetical protein